MRNLQRSRFGKPTGAAVVMVLMTLAMTLAVCYAMLRTQSTTLLIQENEQLQNLARQAALSGLRTALQRMHSANWSGGSSSFQETISSNQSFQVSYTPGDSLLTTADPAYRELPYRVTIVSTGRAVNPKSPQRAVVYPIRVVVRLIPRNFSLAPTSWGTIQNYTIFQTHSENVELDIPCQLQGRIRIQGKLYLAPRYPNHTLAWWTYLEDLNTMRGAGYADCRPIVGLVFLPVSQQEILHLWALASGLRVPYFNLAASPVGADWTNPTPPPMYQLYPGGPYYTVTQLPDRLENASYQPDPIENPLGIYYRNGSLELRNGVSLQGAVFCRDTLSIQQSNVQITPATLPKVYLSGYTSSAIARLPSVVCQNLYVRNTGGGQVQGLVAVFNQFQIDKGSENVAFTLTGRLIARKIVFRERTPWDTLNWEDLYNQYQAQRSSLPSGQRYFPVWLGERGRDPTPRLVIGPDPDPSAVSYHWPRWDQPIFQPHPSDATPLDPAQPGLRWELVRWIEQPTASGASQTTRQSTTKSQSTSKSAASSVH